MCREMVVTDDAVNLQTYYSNSGDPKSLTMNCSEISMIRASLVTVAIIAVIFSFKVTVTVSIAVGQ